MKKRVFILSFFLLFLSSCSKEELIYQFGDWLLEKKVVQYIKFHRKQRTDLKVGLDQYMSWHKKEMLTTYLNDLKRIEKQFKNSKFNEVELKESLHTFDKSYQKTFIHFYEMLSPLLYELKESQVDVMRKKLLARLDEEKDETFKELRERAILFGESFFGERISINQNLEGLVEKAFSAQKAQRIKRGELLKQFLSCFYLETSMRSGCLKDYKNTLKREVSLIKTLEADLFVEFSKQSSSSQKKFFLEKIAGYQKTLQSILN